MSCAVNHTGHFNAVIFLLYTEKLSPQLQVRLALGLIKLNPLPLSPSEKSSSVPNKVQHAAGVYHHFYPLVIKLLIARLGFVVKT
jgi:hypothetical protein